MKRQIVAVLSAVALVAGALGTSEAEARPGFRGHHHRHGGGRAFLYAAPLFVGAYLATRYYYPPTYYYPPAAPVYIEQAPAPYAVPLPSEAQPQSQAYWYYCADSQAYYPHVQSCASGWQRVAPQAPPR